MHPILERGQGRPVRGGRIASVTRKGARLDERVNQTELLIISVRNDKPKTLTGLDQKVCGRLIHFALGLQGHQSHRKIDRTRPILCHL